jgi:tetratricopeptide (TPR) repeat protein
MKKLIWLMPVIAALVMGCSTGSKLNKQKITAQQYYQQGNYQQALNMWMAEIANFENKGQETACPVYTQAAFANMKLGNTQLALDLLKKATYSDFIADSTYSALAEIYRQQDNLSLEMVSLQDYVAHSPKGKIISTVRLRLFELYVESQNWDLAFAEWDQLTIEQKEQKSSLLGYFAVNKALDHNQICDSLAENILKLNENQTIALNWLGKKYYQMAEDRYQLEMKAYEAHKTNKQYKQLLNALDEVTVNFKRALKYFEKLYGVSPDTTTATYLSYIYNRLDDKPKADYYKKLAGI